MRTPTRFALLLAAAVLAGCASDDAGSFLPGTDPALPGPEDPLVPPDGHDHLDPAEHALARNAKLVGHDGLVPRGENPGAHALEVVGDYLYVSTSFSLPGLAILDVANPADMKVMSVYEDAKAPGGDRAVAVSADGDFVFLGAEGGSEDAEGNGVRIVDATDKAAPQDVGFYPIPYFGAHTVFASEIGGVQYVYALSGGVHILRFDRAVPGGPKLVPVGRYATATPEQITKDPGGSPQGRATYALRDAFAHDMFVQVDPVIDRPLMYVAYAYEGLKIVDIGDPSRPTLVASWVPGGEGAPWYVHTVAVTMIGDRRIAVVGSEVFEGRHLEVPSPVWILDVTDLSAPRLLHTWTNPGGHGSDSLFYSAHFLRIEDGRVALSHYHGGMWFLDIRDPDAVETVGYYMPHEDHGFAPPQNCCFGFHLAGIPMTMDVVWKDGVAFAADIFTGVYAVRLTADG